MFGCVVGSINSSRKKKLYPTRVSPSTISGEHYRENQKKKTLKTNRHQNLQNFSTTYHTKNELFYFTMQQKTFYRVKFVKSQTWWWVIWQQSRYSITRESKKKNFHTQFLLLELLLVEAPCWRLEPKISTVFFFGECNRQKTATLFFPFHTFRSGCVRKCGLSAHRTNTVVDRCWCLCNDSMFQAPELSLKS